MPSAKKTMPDGMPLPRGSAPLDVRGVVSRLDRRGGQQRRKLRELAFAGTETAVGLVVVHGVPQFVDEPMAFVVLVDEHVGADISVEGPGVLQRPAHQLAPRRHRLWLESQLKDHRDRHHCLLFFELVTSTTDAANSPLSCVNGGGPGWDRTSDL